ERQGDCADADGAESAKCHVMATIPQASSGAKDAVQVHSVHAATAPALPHTLCAVSSLKMSMVVLYHTGASLRKSRTEMKVGELPICGTSANCSRGGQEQQQQQHMAMRSSTKVPTSPAGTATCLVLVTPPSPPLTPCSLPLHRAMAGAMARLPSPTPPDKPHSLASGWTETVAQTSSSS
ncbi:hypothetical protein HaLaN_26079, partial [Haematococcus lacustris]